MKTTTVLTLLILLLWGCSLTDGDSHTPNRTTGTADTSSIDNIPAGKYDGNWRVTYAHESGYESHKIGNNDPYLDELDNLEPIPDSSVLAVIRGDSIYVYFYDNETDGDTFSLEPILFSDLDEYDTTGVLEGLTADIYEWTGAENVNFTFNNVGSHSILIGENYSLRIEFHYIFDFSYTAQLGTETSSGRYATSATLAYGLVRYDGVIPPDHWPKNYVIDTGDTDDGSGGGGSQIEPPEAELYGSWQMLYEDPEMTITLELLLSEGAVTLTETVTAVNIDTDGDYVPDQTLTGSALEAWLNEWGIVNPEVETGIWKIKDGELSVLWTGDTVPESMPYELAGDILYITTSEGTLQFRKKGS